MDIDPDVDYERLPNSTLTTNLIAGALAGITEHSVMYPVDSIKTRMQFVAASPRGGGAAVYTGVLSALSKVSASEGSRALWRGVNSVLVGAGPAHALYFATYEKARVVFGATREGSHPFASGLAGGCATIVADALMNPFDVVKQRMQLAGGKYAGIVDCARRIVRAEGVGALYISYPTTLMMSIPFQTLHFASYEFFLKWLNPSCEYNPLMHISAGAIAGGIASAATNPLDVAKTLLQTRGKSADPKIRSARGLADVCRVVYAREGARGFAKGIAPRMITHIPSTAISWLTYEYFKWAIGSV